MPAKRARLARLREVEVCERPNFSSGGAAKPGTGLGLFIARSIAEAHGGSVGVESVPGQGSVFRLELPGV